jgi:16S rRNA (cytidine1402-2'-O)-methyltransferase
MEARIIVIIEAPGRLYVVATPIGNLQDMSPRARSTLETCALIAAEDTRHTGTLLKHFGIGTPLVSLHEHNEARRTPELVRQLLAGTSIALVSDAGTPAINDPGFDLVRSAAAAGVEIVAVPGACAALAALSISGQPTDRFCFEGFLPARGGARRTRLAALGLEPRTLVFYESPHRIVETLADCVAAFGADRPATIAREMTKLHETTYRGTLGVLAARAAVDRDFSRGEIVLVVGGAPVMAGGAGIDGGNGGEDGHGGALDRVLQVLLAELPLKQAAHLAAKIAQVRDNEAYKRALLLKNGT